jgi:hypothetical protein
LHNSPKLLQDVFWLPVVYSLSLYELATNACHLKRGETNHFKKYSATAHLNFAYSTELREEFDSVDPNSAASPLWNILTDGYFGFFVPGTKTFAVIGSSGGVHSGIGYEITQTNGNLCGGYCSVEPDDNYNYYWLYDVDEILSAENLADPRPYAYGQLSTYDRPR